MEIYSFQSPSITVPVTLLIKYKKAECRSDKCPVLLMSDAPTWREAVVQWIDISMGVGLEL